MRWSVGILCFIEEEDCQNCRWKMCICSFFQGLDFCHIVFWSFFIMEILTIFSVLVCDQQTVLRRSWLLVNSELCTVRLVIYWMALKLVVGLTSFQPSIWQYWSSMHYWTHEQSALSKLLYTPSCAFLFWFESGVITWTSTSMLQNGEFRMS